MKRSKCEETLARQCARSENQAIGVPGYCQVCEAERAFTLDFIHSDNITPNFRERMVCPFCELNSRQRKMVSVIKNWMYDKGGNVYMYERFTGAYDTISRLFENVTGSEYIDDGIKSGTIVNGVLHEDAQQLSFSDHSFDLLVSCDVFEHINDYKACFSEAYRVMRPQGRMYLTVPFFTDKQENYRRCGIVDEKLEFYAPPVYHGKPKSDEGVLVFWDYGWQMLEDLKEAGFSDVYLQPYYDRKYGYIGDLQYYFVCTK